MNTMKPQRQQHQHQQQQQQQQQQTMPVIVHHSLTQSPLLACLGQHNLKVRVSETTSPNSVIFPMSSVAFFYLHLTPNLMNELESDRNKCTSLLQSVAKFVEVHGHCYVVMVAEIYGNKEWNVVDELQKAHLNSRLQMIPVRSHAEATSAMMDIAKMQLVQDGIGSISQLANATKTELMECALDSNTAEKIVKFFTGSNTSVSDSVKE